MEEIVKYPPVKVEFKNGFFDTSRWQDLVSDDIPDKFNTIKSENDLIEQIKKSIAYESGDCVEFKQESLAEKRSRLMHELAKLDTEEGIETAPDVPKNDPQQTGSAKKAATTRRVTKTRKKTKNNTDSVVDL